MKLIAVAAAFVLLAGCGALPATAPDDHVFTVVIDPGHGGADGGATTPEGLKESGINLEISLRLESLMAFAGVNTVMTRSEDAHLGGESFKKSADIKARLEMAENADILVSIHQNYFTDSRYGGAQVFYGSSQSSQSLAQMIQDNAREALDPDNARTIKNGCDAAYIMKNAKCHAVLVECGFLSNPADAQNLQNEDYQKKTAMAVAAGLIKFKGESTNES